MTANFEKDLPLLTIKGSLRLDLRSYELQEWDFGGNKSAEEREAGNEDGLVGGGVGGDSGEANVEEEIPDYGQSDRLGEEVFDDKGAHCIIFKWNGRG